MVCEIDITVLVISFSQINRYCFYIPGYIMDMEYLGSCFGLGDLMAIYERMPCEIF